MKYDPVMIFVGILALLAAVWLGFRLAAWWRRFWMNRRFARGREGERAAMDFLNSNGYRVIDSQASRQVQILVDGQPATAEVIADFLTIKDGRPCLIEVKTGAQAVDPLYSATRRQLLEYTLAFPEHAVHLLDMEARALRRIEFPFIAQRSRWASFIPWLIVGLGSGIVLGVGLHLR